MEARRQLHTACPFPPGIVDPLGWPKLQEPLLSAGQIESTSSSRPWREVVTVQAFPVDEPVPVAEVEGVYLVVAVEMHDDRRGLERRARHSRTRLITPSLGSATKTTRSALQA